MNTDNAIELLITYLHELRQQPPGCAWTRAQDTRSLAPQTLEECYELVEAIEHNDWQAIKSELGDLLYHVIFYAQIAEEAEQFTIYDIAADSLHKHHQRLPSNQEREQLDAEGVNSAWQKNKIKAWARQHSILEDISSHLPAINHAHKLQSRAASVGFDWPDSRSVMEKLHEELDELHYEITQVDTSQHSAERLQDELGDVLFTTINLARHLKVDAEMALRHANQKFARRFRQLEKKFPHSIDKLVECSLEELEGYWNDAKREG